MQPPPPPQRRPARTNPTRMLNPPPPNRHRRGGGTVGNPKPQTHDPTKPAGRTAQPAESEPNPTGRAASPCVYINHTTHGAGARPAVTHNANRDPFSHTVCRPVRAPAQRGQREEQANPPPKKNGRGETAPTHERTPASQGERRKTGGTVTQPRSRAPTSARRATPQPSNTRGDTHGTR